MNLLLDTCTFLWHVLEPVRLSAAVRHLADPANAFFLSTVSEWEIGVLYSLGRLALVQPPERFVPDQRTLLGIAVLPLEEARQLHVPNLPRLHKDPFDRMLVCQAVVHDLTILTPDPLIQAYPVRTVW